MLHEAVAKIILHASIFARSLDVIVFRRDSMSMMACVGTVLFVCFLCWFRFGVVAASVVVIGAAEAKAKAKSERLPALARGESQHERASGARGGRRRRGNDDTQQNQAGHHPTHHLCGAPPATTAAGVEFDPPPAPPLLPPRVCSLALSRAAQPTSRATREEAASNHARHQTVAGVSRQLVRGGPPRLCSAHLRRRFLAVGIHAHRAHSWRPTNRASDAAENETTNHTRRNRPRRIPLPRRRPPCRPRHTLLVLCLQRPTTSQLQRRR